MKKFGRLLFICILCLGASAMTACDNTEDEFDAFGSIPEEIENTEVSGSSDTKDVTPEVREKLAALAAQDERLTGELENKTIKWLSDWDINADFSGKSTPSELAVFQERYGGEIQWYACVYEERYDMLAKYINADEGIDFFYAGNLDAFPKGAIRSMFVPCDAYIDFDSALWADVKAVNDAITWQDQHYMAVVEMSGDNCAVIYNRDTIQELGFEDPAELYAKNQWDWDIFEEMLVAFCDPDQQKYGIDGWWFESGLSATVGVPYVGLENGSLINYLADQRIERVQNYIYELHQKNCIGIGVGEFGWTDHPEYIGEGKELFYPVGLWKCYSKAEPDAGADAGWRSLFGENCMFVPMPKDPEADAYYVPASMNSYCFVKNGQNPEGVAKFLDCKRATLLNPEIKAIADAQFAEDFGWSQEMIAMKSEMDSLAAAHPVIEFMNGVSTDLSAMLDSSESGVRASGKGVPWSESLGAIQKPVQKIIDEANHH